MRGKLTQTFRQALTAATGHLAHSSHLAAPSHQPFVSTASSMATQPFVHTSQARSFSSHHQQPYPHHHTCHEERRRITSHMEQQHPHRKLHDIGIVAYRVDTRSPEEMKKTGAFLPHNKSISIANQIDNPLNEGFVSWTLLPEVASIFASDLMRKGHKEVYFYAQHIDKAYLMDGSWCQLAVPAVPLAETWCARKVEAIEHDKVIVGELISSKNLSDIESSHKQASHAGDIRDASLAEFADFVKTKTIPLPKQIAISEDCPPEYDIKQTKVTEKFQSIREAEANKERDALFSKPRNSPTR